MSHSGGIASGITRPERNGDCPGKDRLGPYATEEEAARALETVRRRNEEWDAAD